MIRASDSLSRQEAFGLEEGRAALLERLKAYKKLKAWPITVVFDAGAGYHLSEKTENVAGIKVVYSPAGQTADQVIMRLARRQGSQAVVVTSDQALARAAEASGATTIASPDFEQRLEMAFFFDTKGASPAEEDHLPTLSTRKKGPSRRRPKAVRLKSVRLKKI